jgi:hypothetical protein
MVWCLHNRLFFRPDQAGLSKVAASKVFHLHLLSFCLVVLSCSSPANVTFVPHNRQHWKPLILMLYLNVITMILQVWITLVISCRVSKMVVLVINMSIWYSHVLIIMKHAFVSIVYVIFRVSPSLSAGTSLC